MNQESDERPPVVSLTLGIQRDSDGTLSAQVEAVLGLLGGTGVQVVYIFDCEPVDLQWLTFSVQDGLITLTVGILLDEGSQHLVSLVNRLETPLQDANVRTWQKLIEQVDVVRIRALLVTIDEPQPFLRERKDLRRLIADAEAVD